MWRLLLIFSGAACLFASGLDLKRAEDLYQRTEYQQSLKIASAAAEPTAAVYGAAIALEHCARTNGVVAEVLTLIDSAKDVSSISL